jgi:hypothetical protein
MATAPKVSYGIGEESDIAAARRAEQPLQSKAQEGMAAEAMMQSGVRAAQKEESKAKADVELAKSAGEERALGEYAKEQQRLYQEAEKQTNPLPSFKPSQEDLTSYAQLGSMLMTAGLLLGNSGKMPAKAALASMTGMINGWRQGRADLWDKESKAFEKELSRIKAANQAIESNLKKGLELASTNRELSRQKYMNAAALAGRNSIIETAIATGRAQDALKRVQESNKLLMESEKRIQQMAAQNRQAREYQRIQEEHNRLLRDRIAKSAERGRGLSPQQQSFEDMVSISINEAAAQVENLATMKFATTGFWQGRNTKGLLDAPLGVLANKLTSEDVQRYNAVISVIGREAAKVFSGGRIITDKAAEQFANQFLIREGDKPFTVLEKMANIRQFFERAIEVKRARPDVSPGMQKIYISGLESFRNSIPITNKEVNEAKRIYDESKGKSPKTFGQIMQEMKPVSTSSYQDPSADSVENAYDDPEKEARYQKWLKENPQ